MNRLGQASSPYLLQHRDNPVHWWEWGDAAFAEAKRLDRPVILSVGYAACHWCHVMAHESFEDDGVAALMNALFVSIKVDREERPDVDHIYMSALHALGEQGGWPLTMFLTPDREPFWGGTYFPKTARYGRPGFGDLLKQVAAIYRAEPERIAHNTGALTAALASAARGENGGAEPSNAELLALSAKAAMAFDPIHGGLRGAPKFPNAPILAMLWRAGATDPTIRAPVFLTLDRMARGGIHDHLGGGFARYSVDEQWLVPHFEKMLYDNAQLLDLYALAAGEHDHPARSRFSDAADGIIAWLQREMIVWPRGGPAYASHPAFPDSASPPIGLASSLDADSEGEEGAFYVWSRSEIESILLPDDAARFARVYDITEEGNFEGRNIPNLLRDHAASESDHPRLAIARAMLRGHRDQRVHPGRDDKVLTDWNGLMIAALARAGVVFNRDGLIDTARGIYRFLRSFASRDGRLAHSWRGDIGVWPAFALDHAAMALAALALAEIDGDPALIADAKTDLDLLARHYSEGESVALTMTANDGDRLIVRPRPTHDDAVPNANGVYAEALIRHAAVALDERSLARADALFRELGGTMRGQALAHASLWSAFDLRLNAAQIVIAGSEADALHRAALALPWPERIIVRVGSVDGLPADHPARAMAGAASETALAFVCIGQRCSLPLSNPSEIAPMVRSMRPPAS